MQVQHAAEAEIVLMPFQAEGVQKIESFGGRALLADPMGLGKTIQSLEYIRRNPFTYPVLVVCPASVKFHWEAKAKLILGIDPLVLHGKKASKIEQSVQMVIINFDIINNWKAELLKWQPNLFIVDECQKCANTTAKRTKACMAIARTANHMVALSGTPLLNRPRELWPTLNMVVPEKFPTFGRFAHRYCAPQMTPWGWKYDGAENMEELHHLLRGTCMIRRKKSDVLDQLPDIQRDVIPLPVLRPSEYIAASTDFLQWLGRQDPRKARSAKKALAITRLNGLLQLAAKLKLKACVEWINQWLEDTDPSEKLLVFGVHQKMIRALSRRINTEVVTIDGSTNYEKRKSGIRKFTEDPECRAVVGNIEAAGTGLDGLQVASTCVFTQFSWRPGDHSQAEARLHRMGQKGSVWSVYLVAHNTIEEHLCSVVEQKQQVVSSVLDGGKVEADFDVFELLMNKMEVKYD